MGLAETPVRTRPQRRAWSIQRLKDGGQTQPQHEQAKCGASSGPFESTSSRPTSMRPQRRSTGPVVSPQTRGPNTDHSGQSATHNPARHRCGRSSVWLVILANRLPQSSCQWSRPSTRGVSAVTLSHIFRVHKPLPLLSSSRSSLTSRSSSAERHHPRPPNFPTSSAPDHARFPPDAAPVPDFRTAAVGYPDAIRSIATSRRPGPARGFRYTRVELSHPSFR